MDYNATYAINSVAALTKTNYDTIIYFFWTRLQKSILIITTIILREIKVNGKSLNMYYITRVQQRRFTI